METESEIVFKPVDLTTWDDFDALFESDEGPGFCWCMRKLISPDKPDQDENFYKRAFIKQRVQDGLPIGLLAYKDEEPIAWCSVNPYKTCFRLSEDEPKNNVLSLACFFVNREYRDKKFAELFIEKAITFARENGAEYLEACPVNLDAPGYKLMGLVASFEKAGFKYTKLQGLNRQVLIYTL